MIELKIEYLNINELIPYQKNPRYNENAVDYVANSIREFGFKVPIVIDKDKTIVAGHTRLKAAKKIGMKEVPCIIADDLTEQQIQAFRLADNKVGEIATWDMDLLDLELDGITDIDMGDFGFDVFSIDDMEEVDGYNEKEDEREFFEKTFTFPIDKKKQIISYLKVHQNEIVDEIITKSGE